MNFNASEFRDITNGRGRVKKEVKKVNMVDVLSI
jgi:hypothetical protein